MKLPQSAVYLDLLEDGLYAQAADAHDENRVVGLLNDLRFHAALAVLFGRPIVVAEPWFSSSPAFLKVGAELLAAYRPALDRTDPVDRLRSVPFPFLLAHHKFESRPPVWLYLSAIQSRLAENRQLLLASPFGGVGRDPNPNQRLFRERVSRLLQEAMQGLGHGADQSVSRSLAARLGDEIGGAGHEDEGLNLASDLKTILEVLSLEPSHRQNFVQTDLKSLNSMFVHDERKLSHIIHRRGIEEFIPSEMLADFRKMYADLPTQADGSLVSRYLKYITQRDVPESSRQLIWATGRFVLHRSYSSAVPHRSLTVSANWYHSTRLDDPVRSALYNIIGFLGVEDRRGHARNEDGASDIPSLNYDLADSLPWGKIWSDIYRVAASEDWIRFRAKISETIRREKPGRSDHRYWKEIFDVINDRLQTIEFGSRGGYRLTVAKKLLNSNEDAVLNAAKGAEVGTGEGAKIESAFALGLSALKILVNVSNRFVPAHSYFNAIRVGRSLGRSINRVLDGWRT